MFVACMFVLRRYVISGRREQYLHAVRCEVETVDSTVLDVQLHMHNLSR
jgi:hypothetical protein